MSSASLFSKPSPLSLEKGMLSGSAQTRRNPDDRAHPTPDRLRAAASRTQAALTTKNLIDRLAKLAMIVPPFKACLSPTAPSEKPYRSPPLRPQTARALHALNMEISHRCGQCSAR